jgi:hypothetical protein
MDMCMVRDGIKYEISLRPPGCPWLFGARFLYPRQSPV